MLTGQQTILRVRRWTIFFIVGLVLSGATALAISTELGIAVRLLGEDLSGGGSIPEHMAAWLRALRDGIRATEAQAPFMFYGTDWLAFGHFVIAIAFLGALRDPVRHRWLYQFGMLACAAVPFFALVAGQVRGIPVWWRAIDASFGAAGFVPMWLCHRWVRGLELRGRRITDP